MITVADVLPAGLTATAIGGDGWTANLGSLTCTRTDALDAGAAYPLITVTVTVASNAPATVTNTATVAGGESNPAHDTANDVTTIDAAMLFVNPSMGADVNGVVGGPFNPSSQIYTLTNSGGVAMTWTASDSANWNTLSATNGTLAPGATDTVTVSINANANGLAEGAYSDSISFSNVTNGAGTTSRTIHLTVISPNPRS